MLQFQFFLYRAALIKLKMYALKLEDKKSIFIIKPNHIL